ncbi:MAG: hypothetical protein K8963_10655 [Proteobacteria bacterium]|nr:hypothetical protein [Pseudomonadota bacterium]
MTTLDYFYAGCWNSGQARPSVISAWRFTAIPHQQTHSHRVNAMASLAAHCINARSFCARHQGAIAPVQPGLGV